MLYKDFYLRTLRIVRALRVHANWKLLDGGLQDRFEALVKVFKEYPDGLPEEPVEGMPTQVAIDATYLKGLAYEITKNLLTAGKYTPARFEKDLLAAVTKTLGESGITRASLVIETGEDVCKVYPAMPRSALIFKRLHKPVKK